MTKSTFRDLCRCMNFADDWEGGDEGLYEKYNDVRESIAQGTVNHQRKFGMIEDGYNCQWQAMVNFGRHMTDEKIRIAGWYQSTLTIRP